MSQEKQENTSPATPAGEPQGQPAESTTAKPAPGVTAQDVFSTEVKVNAAEDELFVGDLSFLKDLTRKPATESAPKSMSNSAIRSIFAVFIANMLLMLVLVGVVSFQPARVVSFKVSESSPSAKAAPSKKVTMDLSTSSKESKPSQAESKGLADVLEKTTLATQDQETFQRGVSLKTADDLFAAGRYLEACYVYNQLGQNWISTGTNGQYMRDYLKLRMAICMHRAGETHAQEECFTQALGSKAAYIRGLACYYLARIHFQNQRYLEARQMAYQAIALYKAYEDMLGFNVEADLYFLIAESLTREVVRFYNMEEGLPGRDWSDGLMDVWPAERDPLRLEEALCRTAQRIGEGAISPRLTVDDNRPVGSQWSLMCMQSPLEETLWKVISQANLKATWQEGLQSYKSRPVSVYMTYVSQQYVAETLCGSMGLIWHFDGQNVMILNPSSYTDFESHRSRLIGETISIWQRFLLRYRDDKRVPNIHYALGRVYSFAGQTAAALGEFKLLQGRFSQNALAPYAYLEAGKIKVDLKDYEGASNDLKEMLLHYPDCPIIDQATLYLARTTFESGQTERAEELYRKSYQMNLSRGGILEASFGLGRCAYVREDWAKSQTWLSKSLELIEDKNDSRIGLICLMLGRVNIELADYTKAANVLRIALNNKLSEKEYIQTVLELIEAECRQGNYVEAMNILNEVPAGRLGQEDSCNLLITRARVFREIGLVESAISLLRKRIEFIADAQLRALLALELAECYMVTKDYSLARRELNNVLPDMPDAYHARRASLVLAQIVEQLGQTSRAEKLCLAILSDPQTEEPIRTEAFNTLGRIYSVQQSYDKAAMAFAGILPQGAIRP